MTIQETPEKTPEEIPEVSEAADEAAEEPIAFEGEDQGDDEMDLVGDGEQAEGSVGDEEPAEEGEPVGDEEAAEQEASAEGEEPEQPDMFAPKDDGIKRRWYALHAYSGQEGNVKKNLLIHAEKENIADLFGQILIPMEEVAEFKSGEKKISKRKFFPGYVLVQLPPHPERNPELWHLIKETPGVSGFIGSRTAPVPLEDGEVEAIIQEVRGERERPRPKVQFEEGERVKIIDGPFTNFLGNIDEINVERGTLKVKVEIFERLTSVEVEFWQIEKV